MKKYRITAREADQIVEALRPSFEAFEDALRAVAEQAGISPDTARRLAWARGLRPIQVRSN